MLQHVFTMFQIVTNLITPRALFSHTFALETNMNWSRINRFRDVVIQSYTRQMMAAILDLVQTEVETFDPPTRKPHHKTKYEADRMIRCRDMAVQIFPRCEVGHRSVGRSSIYTLMSSLRYVIRNVAREE